MYKLTIGILSDTIKNSHMILKDIYMNTIDPNKYIDRFNNFCTCDDILYKTLSQDELKNYGLKLDQLILYYVNDVEYITRKLLRDSCVPCDFQIINWENVEKEGREIRWRD